MKYIIVTVVLFSSFLAGAFAQNTSGIVEFNRSRDYIKVMDKLPWMSQEDKDRAEMTWGKNSDWVTPYELHFDNNKSIYFEKEQENEYGYSWKDEEYKIIRDYDKEKSQDIIETLDKKYIVEGLPTYKWKILNEIKEVAGYLCMKAETYSEVKDQKVEAWFTDAIPVQGGPEGYYGLPGMILELVIDDGAILVTAKEVMISDKTVDLPMPKKIKGREISRTDFDAKIMKFIATSKETRRNPFWTIRL